MWRVTFRLEILFVVKSLCRKVHVARLSSVEECPVSHDVLDRLSGAVDGVLLLSGEPVCGVRERDVGEDEQDAALHPHNRSVAIRNDRL